MIASSKNKRENYLRKGCWTQEKETRVKFNPRLNANRPTGPRMLHTTIAKAEEPLAGKNWLFAMSSHKSLQGEETEQEL